MRAAASGARYTVDAGPRQLRRRSARPAPVRAPASPRRKTASRTCATGWRSSRASASCSPPCSLGCSREPALRPLRALRNSVARVSTTRDLGEPPARRRRCRRKSARSRAASTGCSPGSSARAPRPSAPCPRRAASRPTSVTSCARPLTSIRANFDALRRNPDMPESQRAPDARRDGGRAAAAGVAARLAAGAGARRRGRGAAARAARPRRHRRRCRDGGPRTASRHDDRADAPDGPLDAGGLARRAAPAGRQPDRERAPPRRLARAVDDLGAGEAVSLLSVEDDGPGVPPRRSRAHLRSVRAGRRHDDPGIGPRARAGRSAGRDPRRDMSTCRNRSSAARPSGS